MSNSTNLIGDWFDGTGSGIGHGSTTETDLSLGDTDVTPPQAFRDPSSVFSGRAATPHKYTDDVIGREDTRDAIAREWLQNERLEEPIPVEHTDDGAPAIVVTAGGQAAIHHSINAALSSEGAALLIEPHYPYHANSVRMFDESDRIVTIEAHAHEQFQPPVERVRRAIHEHPIEVLVICSPANPTGAVYDHEWLERVAALAVDEDLAVVSDEVYAFLTYEDHSHRSIATFPGMSERTLVVGSFSKVFGISGWRLGFVRCPTGFVEPLEQLTDNVAMQSVTPGQVLLEAVLAGDDPMQRADAAVERYHRRMEALVAPLEASPKVTVHRPAGGFYLLPTVAAPLREDPESLAGYDRASEARGDAPVSAGDCLYWHLIDAADVEGVPGRVFGDAAVNAVRFSFGGTPRSKLEVAADRISDALASF
ncbi:pyridoxal phosphate-dependent aminotransferase [Halobaculum rubrum]|uniref:pyridoxal phosphate-dependent aminotransferase n=1 Tax=Halobaculum rubrum TaxID=2872158 RepID=UPI001CA42D20|nr:pyridoxal phosphate-dependent aminotransferase [Halobaculum rubrum]QZY01163.1 pyridoxal phosphate-dependent aminotransferase [Halobaculum rubrum]